MIIKETKIDNTQKTYIVVFENALHSFLTDLGTFTSITLCFWFNHQYIGSKFLSGLLFIFWIIWLATKTAKHTTTYDDKESFINDIKKDLKMPIDK